MHKYQDWVNERLALVDNAIYCKDDSLVEGLLSLVSDDPYVGCDTETYNTNSHYKAFDPLLPGAGLRLVQIEADDQIVAFDIMYLNEISKNLIRDYIESDQRVIIFQNAKFDMKWLKVHLGVRKFRKIYCTLIASQMLSGGRVTWGHSLKDQVLAEFDYDLEKGMGASNWGTPELSESQLKYAFTDTIFLRMLREIQVEKIKREKLVTIVGIDISSIEAYEYMELCGFKLNAFRWLKIAERNKHRAIRMEERIANFLAPNAGLFKSIPTFKVSSDKQLKDALKDAGYELPTRFDPKKKVKNPDTGEVTLGGYVETINVDYVEKLIEKDAEGNPILSLYEDVWQMMVKYSSLKQGWTFYGPNWTDKIHVFDGRIHPDIYIEGTATGRNAFKNPNFQQIPTVNLYRNCFVPEEGSKLIGADYNAAELRILAEASGDQAMCNAFNKGIDLHSYTASVIFKVPYEELMKNLKINAEYKIYRARAKNLIFGIVYGIGATRFAKNADITVEEAYKIIDEFFKLYKGLKRWLEEAKYKARVEKESRSLGGRLFRHRFDESNSNLAALAERNGCNFPIQATNADITKLALHYIYEEIYERQPEFQYMPKLVNVVHDEIVSECATEDAEKMVELQHRCMVKAGEFFIKKIPVLVDISILNKWAK